MSRIEIANEIVDHYFFEMDIRNFSRMLLNRLLTAEHMKLISTKGHNFVADAKQSSYPMRAEAACKSKIQYACGQLLRKKFPVDIILEEWSVSEEGFFVDFFLVQRMLAVEVDGAQHDKFNKFFHGSLKAFAASKARDEKKRLFCEMNKITLLRVKSVEELEGILETL